MFSSSSTDPDMDKIYLLFDWGDGKSSGWLGPYESGTSVKSIHKWVEEGVFEIRCKAKDINGTQSEWSDPYIVSMTKNNNVLSLNILQMILNIFSKFNLILN
jgi:hypothetical protein